MSRTFQQIRRLVAARDVRISEHGYEELANDGLSAREVIEGLESAILIEEYPEYPKGASILVLQQDTRGLPVHVVWGIPKGHARPAVLVTAYRPDPELCTEDFMKRKR